MKRFEAKEITHEEAIAELGALMKSEASPIFNAQAHRILDTLLEIDAEPTPMSTSEAEAAEKWEAKYRGKE